MSTHQRGVALITTLAVVVVVALLVFGAMFTTQIERANARNDLTTTQAEYIARAGLQKYKTATFQAFNFYLANPALYAGITSRYAQCGNLLAAGLDLDRDGTTDGPGDLRDNGSRTEVLRDVSSVLGQYTVSYHVNGATILLRSVGSTPGAFGGKATVQTVVQGQNAGVFSNALFAGGGATNRYVNGGANIWGSVYIQGDPAQPTQNVVQSNGNFTMKNHYTNAQLASVTGLSSSQLASYLKLEATEQKDLCARLRVAYGRVELGGSSLIGEATAPDGFQGRVQSLNVGTGVNSVTTSGSATVNAQAPTGAFDLSQPINFPVLDADGSGRTYCKSDPTRTWRQCLQSDAESRGMVIDVTGSTVSMLPASVNFSCTPGRLSSVISGTPPTLTFGTSSISCTSPDRTRGFTYSYNSGTKQGTLTIAGILDLRGLNVYMQEDMVVRYQGKSTLLVERKNGVGGNVTVDGNVLPGGGGRTFPDADVLGVLAENDLLFTGDNQNGLPTSQQIAVGLFYAGNQTTVAQGGRVLGNITTGTFCTSSNCNAGQSAQIIQVPGLEYNLPPGFDNLRSDTLATYRVLSYERR
ncbi:hypothetical protein [Deinococcus pimensis]|uniref:hypothetical protein n=1 Tax=Deinococcus pimensis TaxID=309888 RepID=UPI000480C4F2|nr:hypothetical protein [Deinococcus pimensis]